MLLSLPGPEGPHVAVLVPLLKDHCYARVPGLIGECFYNLVPKPERVLCWFCASRRNKILESS